MSFVLAPSGRRSIVSALIVCGASAAAGCTTDVQLEASAEADQGLSSGALRRVQSVHFTAGR